jgi:TolA-binding protein
VTTGGPDPAAIATLARLAGEAPDGGEAAAGGTEEAPSAAMRAAARAGQGMEQHLEAGDAFRNQGLWEEAAAEYMAAAAAGKGKQAERALLRAAEIYHRKLGDLDAAGAAIDAYLERFPSGTLLAEALYMGGVVRAGKGDFEGAGALYARYLEAFPSGPQATRVHLALAKILAVKMKDCDSAASHIEAVLSAASGSKMAEQAQKLASHCGR